MDIHVSATYKIGGNASEYIFSVRLEWIFIYSFVNGTTAVARLVRELAP